MLIRPALAAIALAALTTPSGAQARGPAQGPASAAMEPDTATRLSSPLRAVLDEHRRGAPPGAKPDVDVLVALRSSAQAAYTDLRMRLEAAGAEVKPLEPGETRFRVRGPALPVLDVTSGSDQVDHVEVWRPDVAKQDPGSEAAEVAPESLPLESLQDPGYSLFNLPAARSHQVDVLRETQRLAGTGRIIGVWDGGRTVTQHEAFGGRVHQKDAATAFNSHATHVSGTVAAAPPPPRANAQGMAPAATVHTFSWNGHETELRDADADMTASNHSYGPVLGWEFERNSAETTTACEEASGRPDNQPVDPCWVWHGPEAADEDPAFGKYASRAELFDRLAAARPRRSLFVAAGNDRNDNPNGRDGFNGWHVTDGRWAATARRNDGFDQGGFDTIAGYAAAKNVITVGSIQDITQFPPAAADVRVSAFSGWGPMDDGRIKPDVVANGFDLRSPTYRRRPDGTPDPRAYAVKSGTSMAAPVATGIAALLDELSTRERDRPLFADEMKAVLTHTALSPHDGPTYSIGWGAVDALRAARVIAGESEEGLMMRLAAPSFPYEVKGTAAANMPVRVTVVWIDPPGKVNTAGLDDPAAALVNNLDLVLVSPSGQRHHPWRLDRASPSRAAVRCVHRPGGSPDCLPNRVDNIERVDVPAAEAEAGVWTVRVSAPDTVVSQAFALVVSGLRSQQAVAFENSAAEVCQIRVEDEAGYRRNIVLGKGARHSQHLGLGPSAGTPFATRYCYTYGSAAADCRKAVGREAAHGCWKIEGGASDLNGCGSGRDGTHRPDDCID